MVAYCPKLDVGFMPKESMQSLELFKALKIYYGGNICGQLYGKRESL